jgi:hypothetical protein
MDLRSTALKKTKLSCSRHGRGAIPHIELTEDAVKMALDRPFCDEQSTGELLITESGTEIPQDMDLALA